MKDHRLLVEIAQGGRYAPCMYTYRIVNEREHRRAMKNVASSGGPIPEDEYGRDDNILMNEDDVYEIVPRRHRASLEEGWDVRFLLDRWEAFAYYGYDTSDLWTQAR